MIAKLDQIVCDFFEASGNRELSDAVRVTCCRLGEALDLLSSLLTLRKPLIVAVWQDAWEHRQRDANA